MTAENTFWGPDTRNYRGWAIEPRTTERDCFDEHCWTRHADGNRFPRHGGVHIVSESWWRVIDPLTAAEVGELYETLADAKWKVDQEIAKEVRI